MSSKTRRSKGEVHAGFNSMDNIDGIIHWRHIGKHGVVFFLEDWLDAKPREFRGACAYTAGTKLLYAVKSHAELLNPEWKPAAIRADSSYIL